MLNPEITLSITSLYISNPNGLNIIIIGIKVAYSSSQWNVILIN